MTDRERMDGALAYIKQAYNSLVMSRDVAIRGMNELNTAKIFLDGFDGNEHITSQQHHERLTKLANKAKDPQQKIWSSC